MRQNRGLIFHPSRRLHLCRSHGPDIDKAINPSWMWRMDEFGFAYGGNKNHQGFETLELEHLFFSIPKKKHIYPFQTWWTGVLKFEIRWQLPTVNLPWSCHSGASVLPHDCVPNTPRHGPWSWVTLRHSANLQAFGGVQSPAPCLEME